MPEDPKQQDLAGQAQATVKIATEQALLELEGLKIEKAALLKENTELKEQLGQVNALMESNLRSKLITEAKSISKLGNDELGRMTTEELQGFMLTAKQIIPAKKPIVFNADTAEDTSPNITLGSMFAFKRGK